MKKNILLFSLALAASVLAGCNEDNGGDNVTLKEKEAVKGLKMLYAQNTISEQVDWDEIGVLQDVQEYYYYDRGNSSDNKVELLNPDNYTELTAQSKSRKALRHEGSGTDTNTDGETNPGETESEFEEDGTHKQFTGALNEEEFFALANKLEDASKGAKKYTVTLDENYDYVYFEMDSGYKTLNQSVECKMYDNDYLTNDIFSTKMVATDETYENHEEVKEHVREVMSNQTINGETYVVDIMHLYGSELRDDGKYPIPDNYRQLIENPNKLKISEAFSFPMNSGLKVLLSRDYYAEMDKATEWLNSSVDENGNTTLKYNHDVLFGAGSPYEGQGVVEHIYATISSENKLLGYGYDFTFTFFEQTIQTFKMDYVYSYESVGNLELTAEEVELFDYNKYYELGTLLPTIEDGNISEQNAEKLLDEINDYLILEEINQPTGLVGQHYEYMKTEDEEGNEVELESLYHQDSTLYNDNVLITFFSEQGVELDSTYYAESGTIQEFNSGDNNYKIREYYGESRYNNGKVTTPVSGDNSQISLFDENIIKNMVDYFKDSKRPGSGITAKIAANLVEAGIDPETNEFVEEHYVITVQAMTQQTVTESNQLIPAVMYEFEIGFQIIK